MKATPSDRCRALLAQISQYVDDDLTPAQRRSIAAHLRRCPCCQTMAESLRHTVEVCHKAGGSRLPPEVRRRAKARISALLAGGQASRAPEP
jgi:anti-sigma factor RsiW